MTDGVAVLDALRAPILDGEFAAGAGPRRQEVNRP